jgi:diguanylate cyclase (GGDEF)-like protein/PAS domain S-box-containing protein
VQDINERKQYEIAMIDALAQANRFCKALDHIAAYIYMKDHNHHYVYANQPTLDLYKCSTEELIGKDDSCFFPADTVSKLHAIDTRVLEQGENIAQEIESISTDGDKRFFWEVKTPIYDSIDKSHTWGLCGISYDITERKFLEDELKRQARIDYLTGVNNRRHFMEQAEQELNRSLRYKNPLCIFMMDIDFFKKINDSHGHKAGDTVLKKLTEVSQETLRVVDIIGRMGGEEFAILLPETNKDEAVDVAERLRIAIGDAKVTLENDLFLHFTVSIGVAALASNNDLDVLLNLADQALYEAKESGRNKVCVVRQ